MTEITSTADMAETEWDGEGPEEPQSDLVATTEAEGRGIEFHVSMRDYTQRDMEALIIEAAAMQIVGRRNDREIAKAIEARCIELVAAKADAALSQVTTDIIDQPMTPSFGDKKPTTMRELLGLFGREYLTEMVGNDGKPAGSDSWGRRNGVSRMEWIVGQTMAATFKKEIAAATSAVINEVTTSIRAQHKALLEAEKARLLGAIKTVAKPA